MKLKSLFLATLAAMAMASCSNDNDPIENGGNKEAEKTAIMQFRFSYGNSAATRATEAGLDKEQKFTEALLVVAYTDDTTPVVVKSIPRTDFTPLQAATDPATDGQYFQSTPFAVTSGTVNAYVILNPTSAIKSTLTTLDGATKTVTEVETALKGLELTDISAATADNNFIMYGSTAGKHLADKTTTQVGITVERITAKLKEETPTTTYNVTKNANGEDIKNGEGQTQTVNIIFEGYAFTNLTNKSNVVYQSDKKVTTFIPGTEFNGSTHIDLTYKGMGNVADDTQIDYSFENDNTDDVNGAGITSIVYKAKITASGINNTEDTKDDNVYVYNNIVYSFASLQNTFKGLTLTDESSIAEFDAKGIIKYAKGVCYYRQALITTSSNTHKIVRNNVYKLKIATVGKLGNPTIIPVADKTMMLLNLTVSPWTVNENAFNL